MIHKMKDEQKEAVKAFEKNTDYKTANGKSLLENMLDDVNNNKTKYSYNKPYTLEDFYGMLLKLKE